MRGLALVLVLTLAVLVGCSNRATLIDREAFDQRYAETTLAEGVLSVVPLRLTPGADPPTVVNWWYAGSSDAEHVLVYRELTWNSQREPVGREVRYRLAVDELNIAEPFARTSDAVRWLPLYDASGRTIPPPPDLLTSRQMHQPVGGKPTRPDRPAIGTLEETEPAPPTDLPKPDEPQVQERDDR